MKSLGPNFYFGVVSIAILISGPLEAQRPEVPPQVHSKPTSDETMAFLRSAQSPKDVGKFYEYCEAAVQQERVEWLAAAAENPDKGLKFHVIGLTQRLPDPALRRFVESVLTDAGWAKLTKDLSTDSKAVVERLMRKRVQRALDKPVIGDLSKQEIRVEAKMKVQKLRETRDEESKQKQDKN